MITNELKDREGIRMDLCEKYFSRKDLSFSTGHNLTCHTPCVPKTLHCNNTDKMVLLTKLKIKLKNNNKNKNSTWQLFRSTQWQCLTENTHNILLSCLLAQSYRGWLLIRGRLKIIIRWRWVSRILQKFLSFMLTHILIYFLYHLTYKLIHISSKQLGLKCVPLLVLHVSFIRWSKLESSKIFLAAVFEQRQTLGFTQTSPYSFSRLGVHWRWIFVTHHLWNRPSLRHGFQIH